MSRMKDLLGDTPYPYHPGSKTGGTSAQAADAIAPRAGTLKALCLAEITKQIGAPDEIAQRLGRSVLSIRPRITELVQMGLVRKTGQKYTNISGQQADVYERVPQISWQRGK